MRPRARRFAATVLEMARCLAAVLLVLATGCGPESTTATIATIEPLDPEDCGCDLVTGDDGIERVEHRLFGCVPVADLVLITFDIAPDGNGLHRTGYHYQNGVAAGDSGTPRSVVAGIGVGSTFPATFEVQSAGFGNGTFSVIRIPELDGRARAVMPPLGRRRCPGSQGDDDDLE